MKKVLLGLTISLSLTVAHGQLNPIKNLQFMCKYQTPYNCFQLSWSQPDSSLTDTLVGYNIYRNDTLYLFTTNLGIWCDPCIGDTNTTYCGFMYNPSFFYMHVTAVYNTSQIESAYNDSAYNPGCGLIIAVEENISSDKFQIAPNPFCTQTVLQTANSFHNATLTVVNLFGQTVAKTNGISGHTIVFNRGDLPAGVYVVRLTEENKIIAADKLVITDKPAYQ